MEKLSPQYIQKLEDELLQLKDELRNHQATFEKVNQELTTEIAMLKAENQDLKNHNLKKQETPNLETNQHIFQAKLQHTKELLERSNTAARIGTWEIDLATRKVVWSKVTREIHQVDDDFEPNVDNAILFYKQGESRARITEVVKYAFEKGISWDEELQLITTNGEELWVRAIGLTEFENGQCMRIFGTFQDINDRKKAEIQVKQQNEELLSIEEELRSNLDELSKANHILKQKQKALEISEESYRNLVENQLDFVLVSKPDTSVIFANESMMKVLDVGYEQLSKLKWEDFIPSEEYYKIVVKLANLSSFNPSYSTEIKEKRPNGGVAWTHWLNQGIFDENQTLIQIQSVGRDITPLKEAQIKLINEQKRFLDIVDNVDGIVWEADIDTFQFNYVSQKAKRLFGYEIEEWYQPDFWANHLHPEDKDGALNYCITQLSSLQSHELEYRFQAKSGEYFWLRDIVVVNLIEEKAHLRGIMIDITTSKVAERQLLIHQAAMENALDAIAFADLEGVLTYVNQSFLNLWGYDNESEVLGRHSTSFWVNPKEATGYISLLMEQGGGRGEMEALKKDGTTFIAELSTSMIKDKNDTPIQMMSWFSDISPRKNAEKQLKIRMEQLSATLEHSPNVAIQWYKEDGRILYWNKSSEEMFGWKSEEAINKSLSELIYTPAEEQAFLNILQEIKLTGKPYGPFETHIHHRDGTQCWVWSTTFSIPLDENTLGFVCMDVDITAQKLYENEILQANQRLKELETFIDLSSDGIQVSDEKGQLVYINKIEEERLGIPQSEASKYKVRDYVDLFTQKGSWETALPNLMKEKFLLIQGTHQNQKTGEVHPVEVTVRYTVINDKGYVIAISRDISERKKIEEQLYRLSLVAQRTSNMVIITNKELEITWVNEGFTRITGYTSQEAIGKKPKFLQFEETNPETTKYINDKLSKKEPVYCELLNRGKNGRIYWIEMEIQPLRDEQNVHIGFMAIESDITERKKSQEELKHLMDITRNQNQRLSEYAYITSHNIRSSVANLLGILELLKDEPNDEKFLNMMQTSVSKLDNTIHTMNDLLNIEVETQTLEKKSIVLLKAVKDNLTLIQTLIKKIDIEINIPEDLTVKAIPAYLDSILNNLLSNAIKYRRENTSARIEIFTEKVKDYTILTVKDNGLGMDLKKYGHKLFKMNSRFHRQVEGKGIGLFFTKYQIEAMGGKIEVESEPNVGTSFKIWFYENV